MKRLLLINPVCGILSTGRICADSAKEYAAKGNLPKESKR